MPTPLPVIPTSDLRLDPRTYARALSCVHCGLCLPACPTYLQTGNEADSPRGRIQLMRGLSDGVIQPTATVQKHLDLCLDCRGCESACPSGVVYHELIEETRAKLRPAQAPTGDARFLRWLFFHVFVRPTRLKIALLPARLLQKAGVYKLLRKAGVMNLLPAQLQKIEQMLPSTGALWPRPVASRLAAPRAGRELAPHAGRLNEKIALFQGCVGQVMFADVNRKAAELLSASGVDVVASRAETCCGAIHHHNGDHTTAAELAKRNIDAFLQHDPSFIVTNIAGCGAMLKDYDVLLRDDPVYADKAKQFVAKVRDISQVLIDLPLPELKHPVNATATYHDACHLAHAQKVSAPPRLLLLKVPGLQLIMLPESDLCCGAAGTYNLTQPAMATSLAERKLANIELTQAKFCVAANVGCALHLQSNADATGRKVRIVHPVDLLHAAAFGSRIS